MLEAVVVYLYYYKHVYVYVQYLVKMIYSMTHFPIDKTPTVCLSTVCLYMYVYDNTAIYKSIDKKLCVIKLKSYLQSNYLLSFYKDKNSINVIIIVHECKIKYTCLFN